MKNNTTIVKEEINYCILNTDTNKYLYSYNAYGLDKESVIRVNRPSYGTDVNKIRLYLDKDFAEEIIQGLTKYEKGSFRLIKVIRTTTLEFEDIVDKSKDESSCSRCRNAEGYSGYSDFYCKYFNVWMRADEYDCKHCI